jgi:dipeptide/tripeptide permease
VGDQTVIVDPAVTTQRIYMWFYFAINLGSLGSILTALMEHKVGFWSAYLLPLIAFVVALVVVIYGRKRYILRKPQGSVIVDAAKALTIAAKKGWKLDAAKPSRSPNVKWDDQFGNELKRALVA